MGSFQPELPNNSPENRAKNRRVEFVLEKMIIGALP
jgi:outer membrane protein OmpA-like peptidoglycan-associated protein